ncbi:MAG TPA: pyridoxal-phosphate dependent enzyme [Thermoanaerobaculia bacterium]
MSATTLPALAWADIEAARGRIAGLAHRTPVLTSRQFDAEAGCRVFFKAEIFQRGGAFKFRGACNKIKAEVDRGRVSHIVAFSSGNHAQAVALVSQLLGLPATIVMPADAPAAKVAATRGYGAEIVFYERAHESRDGIAQKIAAEKGALLVPPYDDTLIMAGQATAAAELLEEIPSLDALVVPVSGGGLIAGCATAAKMLSRDITIYGVEPETGDDTRRSLREGRRVGGEVPDTIADGLRVSIPGELTFPIVQKFVKDVLVVSDAQMIETLTFLLERAKIVVEPSGVASAAAVRHRKADFSGQKVGVILSGGNVDRAALARYLTSAGA